MPDPLPAEDRKLLTLARSTRARAGAAQGAAIRDENGRTYAGATVDLPSLRLTALQVCVAMAVSSGSRGVEAAVILGESTVPDTDDLVVLRDFAGAGVPLHLGDPRGEVVQSVDS